ncbi:MAG: hypothetical protein R6V57_05650 [Vicinamibacterales bacterium]
MAHEPLTATPQAITLRDSTLREGLDVPGVRFSTAQRLRIARLLEEANVPELEVVAPGRVLADLPFVDALKAAGARIGTSGLLYAAGPQVRAEIEAVRGRLDRFELLMPVSERRRPFDVREKKRRVLEALACARDKDADAGVGFPQSTQASPEFLLEIGQECAEQGATRIVVYDTNGGSDPFAIGELVRRMKARVGVPVFFHGHNDLGMAAANAFAAARAGADGLDVTVNGLGDRAGNASLEQVAVILHLRGFATGIHLEVLARLSRAVADESGLPVPALAPVVGAFVAAHKSAGHLECPELFEAFDPALVGATRTIDA